MLVSQPTLESNVSTCYGLRKEKYVRRTQLCGSQAEDRLTQTSILLCTEEFLDGPSWQFSTSQAYDCTVGTPDLLGAAMLLLFLGWGSWTRVRAGQCVASVLD